MNPPTIIVALIIFAIVVFIIANEINKKQRGESSCSCGCGGCAFKDTCHKTKDTD